MNIEAMLKMMSDLAAADRAKYHLTLGGLIEALEKLPGTTIIGFDDGLYPGEPHSYRGYYEDLSFAPSNKPITAAKLLKVANKALGKTFYGYKGGKYLMQSTTSLWCAERDRTGKAIIGIALNGTLLTKFVD